MASAWQPDLSALIPSKGTNPDFDIVLMRREHIAGSVAIHLDSFDDSLLSSLGTRFLGLMFESFLGDGRESALVCVRADTGQVVSFVCGSRDRSAYLKQALYRYLPKAVPLLLAASVRRRGVAIGVVATQQDPQANPY